MHETWRPVVGFETSYEVSDHGRVRSIDRIAVSARKEGRVSRKLRGKLLRAAASNSGHLTVVLGRGNTRQVHALVLEAFRGPCPPGYEALHADDAPSNNWLGNLRWGTRSDNLHDAVRNKKKPIGEAISHSKLTDEAVRFVRIHASHMSMHALGKLFGVSAQAIKQVLTGATWKHVK